ncbi:MAG: dihydrofolate reductase [Fibrobacter sp.]|nr:dihydrofolate reductase [Fibrobacter sp.]
MKISVIVAVSENDVIGKDGHLPWRLSQDLKRFKAITTGHHIVLGRKNYEDIGRPLPNRVNLVLSRNANFEAPGCVVVPSLEQAFEIARKSGEEELFIIGGAHVYECAMPMATKLYLTRVHANIDGDVKMPSFGDGWKLVKEEHFGKSEKDEFETTFQILERSL